MRTLARPRRGLHRSQRCYCRNRHHLDRDCEPSACAPILWPWESAPKRRCSTRRGHARPRRRRSIGPIADGALRDRAAPIDERRLARGRGWYATFLVLALLLFVVVDHFTGLDVVAATSRFLWNALALAANSATRAAGGLLALLAKGVGWRRLSRLATVIMGVGLSYSGGVILSDRGLRRAKGWTGRLKALAATLRNRWLHLPARLEARHRRRADRQPGLPALPADPVPHRLPGARRAAPVGAGGGPGGRPLVLEGHGPEAPGDRGVPAHAARRAPRHRRGTAHAHPLPARLAPVEIRPPLPPPRNRQAPGELHRARPPVVAGRARRLRRPPLLCGPERAQRRQTTSS